MTPRFTLSLAHFSLLRADNIKANHLLVKGCEYTYFFLNYTLFLYYSDYYQTRQKTETEKLKKQELKQKVLYYKWQIDLHFTC